MEASTVNDPAVDAATDVAEPSATAIPDGEPAAADSQTGAEPTPGDDSPAIAPENFRLEDVPEELRPHAERIEAQFKAAYTRRRQEEAQQLAQLREAHERLERLRDPETGLQELNRLAEELGYEPTGQPDPDVEAGDLTQNLPPELAEKLQAVDELKQAEEDRRGVR
jgi:hypothetical protein